MTASGFSQTVLHTDSYSSEEENGAYRHFCFTLAVCRQLVWCQDNRFCNKPVQVAKKSALDEKPAWSDEKPAAGGLPTQSGAYGGG